MGHFTKQARFRVLERSGFRCHYCGRRPPDVDLHVDHVQAKVAGGSDRAENLVAACADCNHGKRDDVVAAPWLQDIQAARAADAGLEIVLYCRNHDCPSREITLRIKDHDGTLIGLLKTKGKVRCPVCAKPTTLHSVVSFARAEQRKEQLARMSVNTQRYQRDHTAEADQGFVLIPDDVFCDDTLQ